MKYPLEVRIRGKEIEKIEIKSNEVVKVWEVEVLVILLLVHFFVYLVQEGQEIVLNVDEKTG